VPEAEKFAEVELNLASFMTTEELSVEELAAVVGSVIKPRHFRC